MLSIDNALAMAAGNKHQRAIEFADIVQEYGDIHGSFSGHLVVVKPSAVILVPLPDVTFEGHFPVDFEQIYVHLFKDKMYNRSHHEVMARQPGERLALQVCGEIASDRILPFSSHVPCV